MSWSRSLVGVVATLSLGLAGFVAIGVGLDFLQLEEQQLHWMCIGHRLVSCRVMRRDTLARINRS